MWKWLCFGGVCCKLTIKLMIVVVFSVVMLLIMMVTAGLVVSRDRVVSCSTDQTIKVWSLSQESPSLLHTQHTNHGELQCLQACPENSDIICVGGSSRDNNFRVYNISKGEEKQAVETYVFKIASNLTLFLPVSLDC